MGAPVKARAHVARPRLEAWAHLIDVSSLARLLPGARSFLLRSEGPMKQGSTVRITRRLGGEEAVEEGVVDLFDPPRRLAIRSTRGRWVIRHDLVLSAVGAEAEIEMTTTIDGRHWWHRSRLRQIAKEMEADQALRIAAWAAGRPR